jgi:hypothetical protein
MAVNQSTVKTVVVSVSSMMIGAGVGYIVAEKRLAKRFEDRIAVETAQMKTFYTASSKPKYETPQDALKALIPEEKTNGNGTKVTTQEKVAYHKVVKAEGYAQDIDPEEDGENVEINQYNGIIETRTVEENVFDPSQSGEIYLISDNEFIENATDYVQNTITWYQGDDVITDDQEKPLDKRETYIGPITSRSFGEQSDDPNTMHIRNEKLQLEFEVVRSPGYYAVEVLGQEAPIETPRDRINRGG